MPIFLSYLYIGITNAAGRLVIAVIADREIVKKDRLLKMLLFTAGGATAFSPLLINYNTKIVYCCIFGLTIGESLFLNA